MEMFFNSMIKVLVIPPGIHLYAIAKIVTMSMFTLE